MTSVRQFPDVDWTATFEEQCIAAIENYVRGMRETVPEALMHGGIVLDSIVERHLYTLLISDPAVQMHYATWLAAHDCTLPLTDPHVRSIVGKLTGRSIPALPAPETCSLGNFAPAWALVRRMRHWRGEHASAGGNGRPLLLMAHHAKFVRYMRPILDAMPGTGAFLLKGRAAQAALGVPDEESLPMPLATPPAVTLAVRSWRALCVMVTEIETALRRYSPRCVLVAEGDAPYHEALALVGRKLGVPVFCLQWGAFPYRAPHLGFRHMHHKAFLTWGEGFAAQLRPYNPDQTFVSVGSHVLNGRKDKAHRRIVFLMQATDNYAILQDHWRQFMEFTAWTARNHPDWEIVIRPHPSLPLSDDEAARLSVFANVRFQDSIEVPMGEALEGATMAVSLISSAILEAIPQGVFPFLFNPTTLVPRFQPDLEALGVGIETKTLVRAQAEMARLLAAPSIFETYLPKMETVGRHFFAATGPSALQNIVSTLRAAMAAEQ